MGEAASRFDGSIDYNSEPNGPPSALRSNPPTTNVSETFAWIAVIVAGLGYFVDVFDMWLFSNFRVKSLTDLGLSPDEITKVGATLINWQQFGLLLGGVTWGILGDKRGRASVMFGSILLYSIANILNSFVTSIDQYSALRFVSGLGLAGEIGAGITLITELLPQGKRGLGTTLVTGLGVSGAIAAAMAAKLLEWRTAFLIGGIAGLVLLLLRIFVHESGMYRQMHNDSGIKRGSLKLLFSSWDRVVRLVSCILVGVPIYLCFGIFATFSPEIAAAIGITGKVEVPTVMLYASIGITVGDVAAGILSQKFASRRRPLIVFMVVGFLASLLLASGWPNNPTTYAALVSLIGVCSGYWACLITMTAEQFGTNLRATVTTMVPNLIRASAIILNMTLLWLKPSFGVQHAVVVLTLGTYLLSLGAIIVLRETFHRDMNYLEHS